MDRAELFDRVRQGVCARLDALRYRLHADFAADHLRDSPSLQPHFFFAPDDVGPLCELLKRRLPRQAERIIAQAENICRHRFDLLGYEDLDYGQNIDWHCDPVHGKRAARKPWFRIRYLDFDELGDCKIIWELNRHQHLVTLAKAYRLGGDERFAQQVFRQWRQWHDENPYPIGVNWASSLEVAMRSLSWLWMKFILGDSPVAPDGFDGEWLRALAVSGRHIERYLSTYFSPNTHLLGEGVGLFFIGTMCPELRDAERWKEKGWQIVLQEMERQVRPDGFHFEQSTYYHVYAVDFFLHAAVLVKLNGIALAHDFEDKLLKMLDALFLLARAGPPPQLGDDDGGRLFDPARNQPQHLLDPLITGAILFGRGDFKAVAGDLCEETIWLLGEQGVAEWDCLAEQQPKRDSAALQASGLYAMAVGDAQLVIDAGPQGVYRAGHSHADALSITLSSGAKPLLIDPGTFAYTGADSQRDLFRSTGMHNTLCVDGVSQAEPADPFAWQLLAHGKTERWIPGRAFDLFAGSHDGYRRLARPIMHRRWVVGLHAGLFLVRDVVEGEGKHSLEINWHIAPEMQWISGHRLEFIGAPGGLVVLPVQNHGWAEQVRQSSCSPVYGKKQPSTVLSFETVRNLPTEFVTVLLPLPQVSKFEGSILRCTSASSVAAYRYESGREKYSFFFARQGAHWTAGEIASDAEFVCRHQMPEGEELILCHGTYVAINDVRVLSCARVVSRCELMAQNGLRQVFCSDPDAVQDATAQATQASPRKESSDHDPVPAR